MIKCFIITTLSFVSSVNARLPTEQSLLKAASEAVRNHALRYADNPNHETAEELRRVLVQAQARGFGAHFGRAESMNESRLAHVVKYVQVAEVCSVDIFDAAGFHRKSILVKVPDRAEFDDAQLDKLAKACGGTRAVVRPPRPASTGQ